MFCTAANAGEVDDPRTACAIYRAKTKQWKADQITSMQRKGEFDIMKDEQNINAIKDAMSTVLLLLGYSSKQLQEMREWDIGGRLSTTYFFKNNQRIPRSISPVEMEELRGLMGKEQQAVAFCDGLGINVRALP